MSTLGDRSHHAFSACDSSVACGLVVAPAHTRELLTPFSPPEWPSVVRSIEHSLPLLLILVTPYHGFYDGNPDFLRADATTYFP